jgi:hypothetical protein
MMASIQLQMEWTYELNLAEDYEIYANVNEVRTSESSSTDSKLTQPQPASLTEPRSWFAEQRY